MPKISYRVRPETAVLTRGFDPEFSFGSARPPVYRSSTYVFRVRKRPSAHLGSCSGKSPRRGSSGPDLRALQSSQRRDPRGATRTARTRRQLAAIFNSGMAAIFTVMLAF